MNRALTGSVLLLTAALTPLACEDVDVGRPDDPAGGPTLYAIHLQDGSRRGGRFITTNLLEIGKPLLECSYTNPCPAEMGAHDLETDAIIGCQFSAEEQMKPLDDQKGTCNDPLHPLIHPPAVGIPAAAFGNWVRIAFNKQLDNKIDAVLQAEGQTVAVLTDSTGMRVATTAYYDNAGVNLRVAFPFAEPVGPAIVLKTLDLMAGETYRLTIDPTQIKDKDGNASTAAPTYDFTMEALHPYNGITPDLSAEIDSEDVLSFAFQAPAAVAGEETTNAVVQRAGQPVTVTVFIDANCDGDGDNSVINVARTSSTGEPLEWEDGEYTYDLTNAIKSASPMGAKAAADAYGAPLEGTFTVTATTAESETGFENFTLPSQCP